MSAQPNQPQPIISITDQIHQAWRQIGYPQLQSINCELTAGELKLTGSLDSFYLKQVAQSVVVKIAGDMLVINQIDVRPTTSEN